MARPVIVEMAWCGTMGDTLYRGLRYLGFTGHSSEEGVEGVEDPGTRGADAQGPEWVDDPGAEEAEDVGTHDVGQGLMS